MKQLQLGFFSILLIAFSSFVWYRNYKTPIDKALYARFLDEFPAVKMPLVINEEYFKSSKSKRLGYDYVQFIPALRRGEMSRLGPNDFFAKGLIFKNDKCAAVVYADQSLRHDYLSIRLATYTKDGTMITEHELARRGNQHATIQADGTIQLTKLNSPNSVSVLKLSPDGYLVENGKNIGVAKRSVTDKTQEFDEILESF